MVEDLGIKVGTPTEAHWKEILLREEDNLVKNKVNQEIGETLIELAKKRITEEQAKIK